MDEVPKCRSLVFSQAQLVECADVSWAVFSGNVLWLGAVLSVLLLFLVPRLSCIQSTLVSLGGPFWVAGEFGPATRPSLHTFRELFEPAGGPFGTSVVSGP